MITIHEKTAQTFNTLGLGALLPSRCIVTEELNGAYELEMEHPYDADGKWKRIEDGRIIYASTPRGRQPFRIYRIRPDMDGIMVNARHIFYDMLDNQCSSVSFSGAASGALAALQAAFAYAMPFTFTTNISSSGTLSTGRMNPVQALLSDDDETTSFVKGFGGEILRDGFNVSIKASMGQDRDVAIRYGKNLIGLEVTQDESDVKTRIQCYGKNGSATVDSPYLGAYIYPKIHTLEDENKTVAELQEEAQALLDGGADLPLVNIKVDFIPLLKTAEYKDYSVLEEVQLGDIVTVIHNKMNFSKQARVISYEWDCILEQYNEVELGDFMPTLASSVTSGVRSGNLASAAVVNTSAVSAALQAHMNDFSNPHRVTAMQTGGGTNTGDMLASIYDPNGRKKDIFAHETDKNNPHGVTAQQIGAAVAEHTHTPYSIGAAGNPNLLDNWYFADPINQRGNTVYNGSGYTVDRWKMFGEGATTSLTGSALKIAATSSANAELIQIMEDKSIKGKRVTLSAVVNGAVVSGGGDFPTENGTSVVFYEDENVSLIARVFDTGHPTFGVWINPGKTVDIQAVKLEYGAQQTLARQENGAWVLNDAPTNKQQELAKCQRYFQIARGDYGYGFIVSNTEGYFEVPLVTTMRTMPVITVNSYGGIPMKSGVIVNTSITSCTFAGMGRNGIILKATGTMGDNVGVATWASINIDISAEL